MQVGIYIETSTKSPRRMKRQYAYVLECAVNGEDVTRETFEEAEATYHGVHLLALEKALGRLRKASEVTIYAEDPWLLAQMEGHLKEWAQNNFLNAKGEPIKDQRQWLHIWIMVRNQIDVRTVCGKHAYSDWLLKEMKTRKPA